NAIKEFAAEVGTPPMKWAAPEENTALKNALQEGYAAQLEQAYTIRDKQERYTRVGEIKAAAIAALCNKEDPAAPGEQQVKTAFGDLEYRIVRENVLAQKPRIDGRDLKTVRPISVEVGLLPRTHGSALFTR